MFKFLKYSFALLLTVLFFTTCKKYPKNNLWFKAPAVAVAKGGQPWKLTFYAVNDIDSTNAVFLKVWREEGFSTPALSKRYNKVEQDFKCFDVYEGFWTISKNKKQITFGSGYPFGTFNDSNSSSNSSYLNQRYIFIVFGRTDESVIWNIDKLTKTEFRIITNYNGVKYEMHFK